MVYFTLPSEAGEQIARSIPQTQFIQLFDSESDIGEFMMFTTQCPVDPKSPPTMEAFAAYKQMSGGV